MDEYINKIDMFNSSYHKRLLNTSSLYKNIITSLKNKNRNKPSTYNGKKIFLNLFVNYWSKFLDLCDRKGIKLRESVTDNVNALITCGDTFYGFTYYECIECGIFDLVPFTCKSRFCPSCGYKYREERTLEIKKKCIDVKHRHMVFTISDKLRIFFDLDRSLIDDLFEAVNRTFKNLEYDFKKSRNGVSKKKCNRQFGFISTLHTFGRDLKFNPHLHILVAECVLENGHIKNYSYFNYEKMRKLFASDFERMNILPEYSYINRAENGMLAWYRNEWKKNNSKNYKNKTSYG